MPKASSYIFVYLTLVNDDLINEISSFARKHGLKTVAVGFLQDWCDLSIHDVSPVEWISHIKNANLVISSSYHGIIFSLIFRRPYPQNIEKTN